MSNLVILRPRNAGEHGARRELLIVDAEALHDAFDHGLLIALVVDHESFRVSNGRLAGRGGGNLESLDVTAEDAHAEGMKGRDDRFGNAETTDKLLDALTHFGSRLVGESHG